MSENDAAGAGEDVEEVLADEETLDEGARSFADQGSDADPGSMLNP